MSLAIATNTVRRCADAAQYNDNAMRSDAQKAQATIAPEMACTMPGRSSQTSVRIQCVESMAHKRRASPGASRLDG